ncbi:MAG: hypothetical protein EA379_00690 [Phycisphaerales bacterium]|nr:MAG: hypothetical protein EA379_00690 [Phycisphaerales bacterium]
MQVPFGLFLVCHGLVHAIYVGHARRLFEVRSGVVWPDGSWALSRTLGDPAARWFVAVTFSLVAAAFTVAAIALVLRQPWWAPLAGSAAAVSALALLLAWDGRLHDSAVQGAYAVVLDVVIAVFAVVVSWPHIDA